MLAWRCRRPISAPAPALLTTCAPQPPCCGRRVAAGVKLMVAPASLRDQNDAEREGAADAAGGGAQLLPTSCGACAGYGGSIPDGATVISTTARNFKGRMGSGDRSGLPGLALQRGRRGGHGPHHRSQEVLQ